MAVPDTLNHKKMYFCIKYTSPWGGIGDRQWLYTWVLVQVNRQKHI